MFQTKLFYIAACDACQLDESPARKWSVGLNISACSKMCCVKWDKHRASRASDAFGTCGSTHSSILHVACAQFRQVAAPCRHMQHGTGGPQPDCNVGPQYDGRRIQDMLEKSLMLELKHVNTPLYVL